MIRSKTNDDDVANWPQYLPYAVFVVNSQTYSNTNYSPHEMIYGYKLTLPTNLKKTPDSVYTYDNYLNELRFKLQLTHSRAREHMIATKEASKEYYDQKSQHVTYKVGDKVLLTNEQRRTKLHNPFIGPFEILEIISDVNIRIQMKLFHNDTISKS